MFGRLQALSAELEAAAPAADALPPPLGCDGSRTAERVAGRLERLDAPIAEDVCCICLEPRRKGQLVLRLEPCGHCFHQSCSSKWLEEYSASCPMCKAPAARPVT